MYERGGGSRIIQNYPINSRDVFEFYGQKEKICPKPFPIMDQGGVCTKQFRIEIDNIWRDENTPDCKGLKQQD